MAIWAQDDQIFYTIVGAVAVNMGNLQNVLNPKAAMGAQSRVFCKGQLAVIHSLRFGQFHHIKSRIAMNEQLPVIPYGFRIKVENAHYHGFALVDDLMPGKLLADALVNPKFIGHYCGAPVHIFQHVRL